jgi:hypothetical protein
MIYALVATLVFGLLLTDGILWNKPKPKAEISFAHAREITHQWGGGIYEKQGEIIVGTLAQPAFLGWLFDTHRIYPIRLNPQTRSLEWLNGSRGNHYRQKRKCTSPIRINKRWNQPMIYDLPFSACPVKAPA